MEKLLKNVKNGLVTLAFIIGMVFTSSLQAKAVDATILLTSIFDKKIVNDYIFVYEFKIDDEIYCASIKFWCGGHFWLFYKDEKTGKSSLNRIDWYEPSAKFHRK